MYCYSTVKLECFTFILDKTKFVVFKNTVNIIVQDQLILKSESALPLYVHIDKKLTFSNHIYKIYFKISKIQGMLINIQFLLVKL